MSWDILIFTTDPRQLSNGVKPPSLGEASDVRTKISKSLPEVNWKDPAWGVLEGKGWSIEFNHQTNGIAESVMLHVRGGGDPVSSIVKFCKDNGWVALDTSSGELLNLDAPSAKSWQEFQAYRDKVVATTQQPPPSSQNFVNGHLGIFLSGGLVIIFVIILLMRRK